VRGADRCGGHRARAQRHRLHHSPSGNPATLVVAVDGVLVAVILIDMLRTVLTHLEGRGVPFRPFLVIGIIAAVREILAVSTRLTLTT